MRWRGPLTWRQYLAWHAWQDLQWNRPDRTDHYLMAIIYELACIPSRVWGKNPKKLKLQHCKLEFTDKESKESEELEKGMTLDEKAAISQSTWFSRLGGIEKIRRELPDGTLTEVKKEPNKKLKIERKPKLKGKPKSEP